MPDIKLVIYIRVVSFHVRLNAYIAISCDNLYFCPPLLLHCDLGYHNGYPQKATNPYPSDN